MTLEPTAIPRSRQEELGQFLTATPVADFMASMFGPRPPRDTGSTARDRWGLLVKAIINNWMRSRSTIEFLGLWEKLSNPGFKPFEFERFRASSTSQPRP